MNGSAKLPSGPQAEDLIDPQRLNIVRNYAAT